MKNLFKAVCLVLAVSVLITAGLTGCGTAKVEDKAAVSSAATESAGQASSAAANAIDTSKEVSLKMYLIGDKPKDYDAVWTEVNKSLKQKVNATVETNFLSWGDYTQKYPLLFASGENLDLVYTSNWCFYKVQAAKNAFKELTDDDVKKYAPGIWEEVPQEAWKQSMINGKRYAVPYTNFEFGTKLLLIRGDLREKYGIPEIKTLPDVQNYLYAVAKNEKGIIPYDVGGNGSELLQVAFTQPNGYDNFDDAFVGTKITDPDGKLFWYADDPKFLEYLNMIKEWKDNGAIPKDAAAKKAVMQESFLAGKTAMFVWNIGNIQNAIKQINGAHSDWKAEMVDLYPDKPIFRGQFTNNMMAINNGSNNVERSLMVLDLLRNDKDLHDMTMYGIEGKHWKAEPGNKESQLPDGLTNFTAGTAGQWGWMTGAERDASDNLPARDAIFNNWKSKTIAYPLNGFSVDTTKVKTEAATIANLRRQYLDPLTLGAIDAEQYLSEYKTKMKAAGFDKYFAEAQKQAQEYFNTMK